MPNLFASLSSLSNGLRAFEQSLTASQNNVGNASTPGYARQTTRMEALPFDSTNGQIGGVSAGEVTSARDRFAELAVQRQTSNLGQFQESAALLTSLNQVFELSGPSSVPGGFDGLVQSFSAWSVAPQSQVARQQVVSQAEQFASNVRNTAQQLRELAVDSEKRLQNVTSRINTLGQKIASINRQRTKSLSADPALDTALYSALEELSSLANFTALPDENGVVNVLLGGQTPLVLGQNASEIRGSVDPATGSPAAGGVQAWRFFDSNGQDITGQITSGSARALLDLRNSILPGLIGGQGQTGALNELVTGIATRINDLLTSGQVSTTGSSGSGAPLFSFGDSDPAEAAATFKLNDTLSQSDLAAQLAPVETGPPLVANGIALQLAGLTQNNVPANQVQGLGFLAFFGKLAADAGSRAQVAADGKDRATSLLTQAKAARQDASGVSLDEEAARIIELQRGYQAISRVVSVIDQMTDSLMSMIR